MQPTPLGCSTRIFTFSSNSHFIYYVYITLETVSPYILYVEGTLRSAASTHLPVQGTVAENIV